MKFGALPESRLSSLDLSLPKEPFINTLVLPGVRAAQPRVYVGAATWGHSSWTGTVYPPKAPATRFRQLYTQSFNAIEMNATHYKIYAPEVIRQWGLPARTRDFKFCPKFPQQISHYGQFEDEEGLTAPFLESISAFEQNLGPVFLQLGENYGPAGKDALFHYLASLPRTFEFFLEVRHPAWFADPVLKEELFSTLRLLGIGAVITDTPGRRDAAHMYLTLPKAFVRFVCNSLHPTSFSRTDDWITHLQPWIDNGLEEAYIFLHPGDETAIPDLAAYWVQQVNRHCRLQLHAPGNLQNRLF